jgi:hypothetical protein
MFDSPERISQMVIEPSDGTRFRFVPDNVPDPSGDAMTGMDSSQ